MRLLIATVQHPFVRGGAEVHAESLRRALVEAGHEAEIVAVPFKHYPPHKLLDQMLACRLLEMNESCGAKVDRVIGLRFPAYLIPHPNKVLWILHQHRPAYELWGGPWSDLMHHPDGLAVRDAIRAADTNLIPESRAVYANSLNVARRLRKYCRLDSTVLYHPPQEAERFRCEAADDYLFFPSRLTEMKRQRMVLEALALTREPVRVRFSGAADDPRYQEKLKADARRLGVEARVTWLGRISDDRMRREYARALGVVYPPVDEDYGYVTLEAMLSGKPVITCTDSGGPLEFIEHGETGLAAEPTPAALAAAMDELWADRARAARIGRAARDHYASLGIGWDNVVERLTA